MSPAAVAQPVTPAQTSSRAHALGTEPAWPWPIDTTRYDRTPTLSMPEAEALTVLDDQLREWRRPRARRSVWRVLDRLVRPLADVRAIVSTPSPHQRQSALQRMAQHLPQRGDREGTHRSRR